MGHRCDLVRLVGAVVLMFAAAGCGAKQGSGNGGAAGMKAASGGVAGTGGASATGGMTGQGSGGTTGGSGGRAAGGNGGIATGGNGGVAMGGMAGGMAGTTTSRGGPNGGAEGGNGGRPSNNGGGAGGGSAGASGSIACGAGGAGVAGATFTVQVKLASDVSGAAPGTIGIVTWTTTVSALTDARIEFGLDTCYGMAAPVELTLADHRTLLLGMKPARTYHFRVVAHQGATTYRSGDYTVTTGPPTSVTSIKSFQVMNPAAYARGFIILSYWGGSNSGAGANAQVPFILDSDGEIVWWGRGGASSGIARARISADGKNMWMAGGQALSGEPLQRLTMDTLTSQTYPKALGTHDLTPVSGDVMAYIDYATSPCDVSEIDPSGTTRKILRGTDVLSLCHGAALRYSAKEDVYTFSSTAFPEALDGAPFSDVYVMNRSGAIQWTLSQLLPDGSLTWGGVQHGHQLLDDGFLLFANLGAGTKMSAVYEFGPAGEQLLNYVSGDYSGHLGDVQRLPGGNTLITYAEAGVIKEIDPQGNVVMQITGPDRASFGYALWQDDLYGPPSDFGQ